MAAGLCGATGPAAPHVLYSDVSAQCSIAWLVWSLPMQRSPPSCSAPACSVQWSVSCGGWNTSCNSDVELQEQSQDPGDVPVALVGLATKLWQHKCQSPAEPLSLLGLGFQQWKHLVRPAWICEHGHRPASKSDCCSAQPIGLHNARPQILHPAFHSASVG